MQKSVHFLAIKIFFSGNFVYIPHVLMLAWIHNQLVPMQFEPNSVDPVSLCELAMREARESVQAPQTESFASPLSSL